MPDTSRAQILEKTESFFGQHVILGSSILSEAQSNFVIFIINFGLRVNYPEQHAGLNMETRAETGLGPRP